MNGNHLLLFSPFSNFYSPLSLSLSLSLSTARIMASLGIVLENLIKSSTLSLSLLLYLLFSSFPSSSNQEFSPGKRGEREREQREKSISPIPFSFSSRRRWRRRGRGGKKILKVAAGQDGTQTDVVFFTPALLLLSRLS